MNRGSDRSGDLALTMEGASMRPRFMNRGSDGRQDRLRHSPPLQ